MQKAIERVISEMQKKHGGNTPAVFLTCQENVDLIVAFPESRAIYGIFVDTADVYGKSEAEKLLESDPEVKKQCDRVFAKLKVADGPTQREPVGEYEDCTLVRVVDADTIDVVINETGERKRVRFLAVDTEESYDTTYKTSTALGLGTKSWTKKNLDIGMPIRVEFDETAGREDVFDRMLGYVWYKKGDNWTNMNFELVARGLSPFSTKYGFPGQREDHPNARVLSELQQSARENGLGIWDPAAGPPVSGEGYEEEGATLLGRARSLERWESEVSAKRPDILAPHRAGDFARVGEKDGERVTVHTAWFIQKDKEPYFERFDELRDPREPAIFQLEGDNHKEVWTLVVEPPAPGDEAGERRFFETVRALIDQEWHYRYLTGKIRKTEEGITVVFASADDLSVDPPGR
jgi:endonuclease YncB( thermonuclease family)